MADQTYTVEAWLRGMVADFDIPDATIKAVLYNNSVDGNTDISLVSEKDRDLSLADLYMALATSSSKSGSVYDSDGGWQKGRSTKNVVDRRWFRDAANRLYLKWGSDKADTFGNFVLKGIY